MNATTTKKAKSIEFFKAKLLKLRDAHNKRCEMARKGEINWKESLRMYHANIAERQILMREVENAGLHKHILNKTVTFQSGRGYEGNHELGDALEKQFPHGKDDSESGQGFFYVNEAYVEEVLAWLKGKVEVTKASPEKVQKTLLDMSQEKSSAQVSDTAGDGMLK